MARQKAKPQNTQMPLTSLERLGLRVSAMLTSPRAQVERRVLVHRLDGDTDDAWEGLMELLADTEGLSLEFDDAGNVEVRWEAEEGSEAAVKQEEMEEEPVPF